MPYCPNCRDEFRKEINVCPDCKIALVEELPPLPPEQPGREGKLVLITIAPNQIEAELWKNILEDNGISSMIKVSESVNLYMSPFLLKHELYVIEPDADKAHEILDSISEADFTEDETCSETEEE